jgi:hypothetical protein
MTERVLIGNRTGGSGGGYGLYVSKANSSVLNCDDKDLLFSTTDKASGTAQVYAGGTVSSLSSAQNFLTTGSKDNLGYIPLVITNEDYNAVWNWGAKSGGSNITIRLVQSNVSMFAYTSSTLTPCQVDTFPANNPAGVTESRRTSVSEYGGGTGGSQACVNLNFVVLKIPCAYGYMTSTYF